MTWFKYTLTSEHCIICHFVDYLYLGTYIVQCINVDILCVFCLYELYKYWVAMNCPKTVTCTTVRCKQVLIFAMKVRLDSNLISA